MKDAMAGNTSLSVCPGAANCSGHPGEVSFTIGLPPSYVSLVSSAFSCLGSLLILLAFLTLPEIRTLAQKLITLLAIADFFTAFGYFMAAINFLAHFDTNPSNGRTSSCGPFHTVCEIQSFITTTSSLCSFLWTTLLAVYFHVVIVNKQTVFSKKALALCNLFAWGLPLVITIPLVISRKLGYIPYAASNWCFIKDTDSLPLRDKPEVIGLILVAGKFWEITCYVLVTVLYISIAISINKTRRKLISANTATSSQVEHVEMRLLAIPVVFILLRMWGTTQFFYSLSISDISEGCIAKEKHKVFLAFGILQAVGDSGQGWSNAILYIFLSPTIRNWFICDNLHTCYSKMESFYHYFMEDPIPTTSHSTSRYARVDEEDSSVLQTLRDDRAAINRAKGRNYGTSPQENFSSFTEINCHKAMGEGEEHVEGSASGGPQRRELLDTASFAIHTYK